MKYRSTISFVFVLILFIVLVLSIETYELLGGKGWCLANNNNNNSNEYLPVSRAKGETNIENMRKFVRSDQQTYNSNSNSKVQFIFVVGLEGTGHHLMQTIVKRSPAVKYLTEIGIYPKHTKRLTSLLFGKGSQKHHRPKGLFRAQCNEGSEENESENESENEKEATHNTENDNENAMNTNMNMNVTLVQWQVAQTMKDINERVILSSRNNNNNNTSDGAGGEHVFPGVINIPANTLHDKSMMSYPFGTVKECRKLNYPSLGLYYAACRQAQVDCGHVYIFRDPYKVLHSTAINRNFNPQLLPAIHMYKSFLDIISLDLLVYRSRVQGCFGLFEDTTATDSNTVDWWGPIGKLFGWEQKKEFEDFIQQIYKSKPASTSDSNSNSTNSSNHPPSLVPAAFSPYMQLFEESHQRAIEICLDGWAASSSS